MTRKGRVRKMDRPSVPPPKPAPRARAERQDGKRGKERTPASVYPNMERGNLPLNSQRQRRKRKRRRRPPRTEAIAISCPPDTRHELMRTARSNIDLAELNIPAVAPRKGFNGNLLLEIPGSERDRKADALARKLQDLFFGMEGVKVSRPRKCGELRIWGLEESVSETEISAAIANTGECDPLEVKVGTLRVTARGRGLVWVKCPLESALKIANEGKLMLGWSRASVELLDARPAQCFRCLERGHARAECNNPVDRSGWCLRCGKSGHVARGCVNPPNCPICQELGRPANHRVGGPACRPPVKGRRGRVTAINHAHSLVNETESRFTPCGNPEESMETEALVEVPKGQRPRPGLSRLSVRVVDKSREEAPQAGPSNGP